MGFRGLKNPPFSFEKHENGHLWVYTLQNNSKVCPEFLSDCCRLPQCPGSKEITMHNFFWDALYDFVLQIFEYSSHFVLDHTGWNSCLVGNYEPSLLLIQCCYVSALFCHARPCKISSTRHKTFFNATNSPLRGSFL